MKDIHVLDIDKSLTFILENQSSVARFGDGEIDIIAGNSIPYQDYHKDLAERLRAIIETPSSKDFLVCMPDVFERTERYNQFARDFWQGHLSHYETLYNDIKWSDFYGSTFISRPYIDLEEKSAAKASFAKLKQVWHNRDCLIVEGVNSRSGVGNDLFANAKSISRIICPPKNAYQHIDEIERAILKHGQDKLVLVMLGPTAKLIAQDLSKEGLQVIDLGHIDSEYEWYKMGATSKVKLANKHTAEFNYDDPQPVADAVYASQIVADITKKPLVTVVVPVYNSEAYLEACIASILRQTYQNLELLLINDGSTDGSAAICEAYKEKDARVRVHHKRNGGVGSSRNAALELSKGDYLLFVDNDDWISDEHIEKLYRHLVKTGADIAVANFTQYIEESQTFLFHVPEKDYYEAVYTPEEWFAYQYDADFCLSQCFTVPWTKLYKRSLFKDIVYPTDKKVEDDYTTYKIYLQAEKIAFFNEAIYLHRKKKESVINSVDLIHVFPLQSIEERMMLLSLLGMDISGEQKAYRRRLQLHKEVLLQMGDIQKYREVCQKIAILNSHL